VSFEGSAREAPFPSLGLTLAPAHHTVEARRAVGLPGLAGLLVRDVQRGSRAERAGIRPGDVLIRAAGSELRSITALYAAISDAPGRQTPSDAPGRQTPSDAPGRQTPSDAPGTGTLGIEIVRGENTAINLAIDLRPQPGDDLPPGNTSPPTATAAHTL
jgi:hypothetical protein